MFDDSFCMVFISSVLYIYVCVCGEECLTFLQFYIMYDVKKKTFS